MTKSLKDFGYKGNFAAVLGEGVSKETMTSPAPTIQEGQWRPIETAPKDGTKILAFGRRDGKPVFEVTYWRNPKDNRGYVGWGEFNMEYWPPTHWIPLPDPPKAQGHQP